MVSPLRTAKMDGSEINHKAVVVTPASNMTGPNAGITMGKGPELVAGTSTRREERKDMDTDKREAENEDKWREILVENTEGKKCRETGVNHEELLKRGKQV